ncbi:hypothetical protein RN001_010832 [Aquatica leii]|uniref:Uncharacterized protein n=1 Tax=Aquatica leii TaxID=1421715 RepID=A0AAN7S8Q2_9COLE|nr:hypothetical protein RN001_010832 [Aquatica leii]
MRIVVLLTLTIVLVASADMTSNDISAKNPEFSFDEFMQEKNKDVEKKAERLNRNFERMLQLVNILGQVDNFLSERVKLLLRKLALLAEDDDYYNRKKKS